MGRGMWGNGGEAGGIGGTGRDLGVWEEEMLSLGGYLGVIGREKGVIGWGMGHNWDGDGGGFGGSGREWGGGGLERG